MWRDVKQHYRVRYTDNEGVAREFHILEENCLAAVTDLRIRMGIPKENVIGVDVWHNGKWEKDWV